MYIHSKRHTNEIHLFHNTLIVLSVTVMRQQIILAVYIKQQITTYPSTVADDEIGDMVLNKLSSIIC